MEIRKALSIACLLVFIICLLCAKSKRRTYVLFVLYFLPLIDLYITPVSQGGFSVFDAVSYLTLLFIFKDFHFTTGKNVIYLVLFLLLSFLLFLGSIYSEFVNTSLISMVKFFPVFIYGKALIEEINSDPGFSKKIINVLRIVCLISIIFLVIQMIAGLRFSLYTNLNTNVSIESSLRYPGYFQDPQKFAQFLSLTSFFFLIKTNKPSRSNLKNYLFFLAVIIAMFLTGARAAFLGLCVGLAIVFLVGETKYRKVAIIGALAGYIIVTIFSQYFPIFNREESYGESYEFRNQIWKEAVGIFNKNPFLGIGIGNYQSYVEVHAPDQFWYLADDEIMYFDHPESGYLKMLTEYGLFGFILICSFIIIPVYSALKRYFNNRTDSRTFYFIGAITAWMISYITVYSLSDKRVLIPLAVHICLLITTRNRKFKAFYERKNSIRTAAVKQVRFI